MINQELLRDLTESYLKGHFAEALNSSDVEVDSYAAFGELGIDSFNVLKILKKLEGDFGSLPKTLLFEYYNVNDLAAYFTREHVHVLNDKFATALNGGEPQAADESSAAAAPVGGDIQTLRTPDVARPLIITEKAALEDPELSLIVGPLFALYKNEGSVSRGTRSIAPNLFIGTERRGYINFNRRKNLVLTYSYVGPDEYFSVLAGEIHGWCLENKFKLNMLSDNDIESVGGTRFSSTPFGALQRILNLRQFTLEGGAMRRLRYQVTKFEKAGVCRTVEYRCGTDSGTDLNIAAIIDDWCGARAVVNPLIYVVRNEILAGGLHSQHRLFLTYVDDVLQNVILISEMSAALNGYLMDLEFYTQAMPLGGLEYAIVKIIEVLVAEGRDMLSMGGTYGVRLTTSTNADPEVNRVLDDLQKQNIFNDSGNLQFKNKFRTENKTIYLSRPVGSGSGDSIIDIIMMIADPSTTSADESAPPAAVAIAPPESPAAIPATPATPATTVPLATSPAVSEVTESAAGASALEGSPRWAALAAGGFNPMNIPQDQIEFDLKTDSWAQLSMPAIDTRMAHLHSQLQQPLSVDQALRGIFPFQYFVLTESGRSAEHFFYEAWTKKGAVLQNLLFPTGIFHQIDQGFTPAEMVDPQVFRLESSQIFKGNLALDLLRQRIAADSAGAALVVIELTNNAAGGCPVSLHHLADVKALLTEHSIPLVLDATRVIENARFVLAQEAGHAGKRIWALVSEMLSLADTVIASLAKDFCVNRGGLIATNDAELHRRVQRLVQEQGSGLDVIDKKLIGLSLHDRPFIETQVLRRMDNVETLWATLESAGIPVVRPAGAHCILLDVKQVSEFEGLEHPVASFLAWMFLNSGIRAGAHSVGMQKRTALNGLVRLAVPVGTRREDIEELGNRLVRLFAHKTNIPELVTAGGSAESFGEVYSKYRVGKLHNAGGPSADRETAVVKAPAPAPAPAPRAAAAVAAAEPRSVIAEPQSVSAPPRPPVASTDDIAIVGMAGRYPKAKNLDELWDNLVQGRDCISDLPPGRHERRLKHQASAMYRGGFIDDVDKFDSLFFNISPREAEMLDPQERLFLEVAWEALEDAGYYPEILAAEEAPRNIGVFVGAVWAMYQMLGVEERHLGNKVLPNSFLWSVANRVSYWMNLSGPSLTLDTACSSSLTALHLACQAIQAGTCSSAIVGGVNLDLHQSKLDINLGGGALSRDGLCRSFGRGANGYVAGEGVGALFLKPLAQSVRDGDHIYGVIKSVVVNHGGRTSGYTVPNPKAQTGVITAALAAAGVDARSIGYIEAHGTGTELGDPIEVAGLSQAFKPSRVDTQSCAIGSIKSNIGHLEAAAGLVSITKVLLQMKHRQLVPSLHSAELNEFIDFGNSPFYVEQRVEPWVGKEVDGVRFPLRAGVSSFGAGGSNAHVVLESYEPPARRKTTLEKHLAQIFPLSARNEEQLREVAKRLRRHAESSPGDAVEAAEALESAAYTLQVGRKSFDHRLTVVAGNKEELIAGLTRFIEGKPCDTVCVGHVKNAEGVTRHFSRTERKEFVNLLSQRRDPLKLAQLWVDGLLADWRGFHAEGGGARISLPTYPFADKRHWAGNGPLADRFLTRSLSGMHPLLDSNESTFGRQIFRKKFHGRDFFIYDHLVANVPTLPGVAYLELARKAGEIAAGRKVRRIRNILWVSPITVRAEQALEVSIELKPSGETVQFEVFSSNETGSRVLHSQGKLLYATAVESAAAAEFIDLEAVRSRCVKVIDGRDAYPLFEAFGLNLGPSFQVLQEVYKNDSETLGVLKLPEFRSADLQELVLHPSLVDGSLQAGMAAQLGARAGEMLVPYTIGEVEILHPLPAACFSYITEVRDDKNKQSRVSKTNVLIVDEHGKILVRIRESIGVPLREVNKSPDEAAATEFEKLYYAYDWAPAALEPRDLEPTPCSMLLFDHDDTLCDAYRARLRAAGDQLHRVVLVLSGERFEAGPDRYAVNPRSPHDFVQLFDALSAAGVVPEKICYAWSPRDRSDGADTAFEERLDLGVYAFLSLCQALVRRKLEGRTELIYLYAGRGGASQPHDEAMTGFLKAFSLEHPKSRSKVVELRWPDAPAETLLDVVLAEFGAGAQDGPAIRYDGTERHVKKLRAFDPASLRQPPAASGTALRQKGVYLITGGAGGLGWLFAHFLSKEYSARLVLTGRSASSPEQETKLEALRALGAEVVYVPADVANRADVDRLIADVKRHFGELNGVIHGAGVLRDSYVRNKTALDLDAVFAPKVHGTRHLDEATRFEKLDFFALFSSVAGVAGNAGQCDYCFANHFMDCFAVAREELRAAGARPGKTLSLNWSLWADGGMKLDEQTELFFKKSLGIKALTTRTGLEAFVDGLASGRTQFAVLEGVQDKVELAWGLRKKEAAPALPDVPAVAVAPAAAPPARGVAEGASDAGLRKSVQGELTRLVMSFLKLEAGDVAVDEVLLNLGFDSIGLTTYANAINETYGVDITPVVFFDYPSITEIAKYLVEERRGDVARFHGRPGTDVPAGGSGEQARPLPPGAGTDMFPTNAFGVEQEGRPAIPRADASGAARATLAPERRFVDTPIAIVGMSGVMPQSSNLEEFWENLRDAKNLVSLIPQDRWSWEEYFGDPLKEVNKSNSKWGGFMRDVDLFDPLFFGISPREAQMMDPQQRLFLETVWKTIEDSGHRVADLSGTKTGLFVGVATNDYVDLMNGLKIGLDGYSASGNSHSVLANRVSFLLNLRGPSAPLDTACSSSLVAIHRAIESIHTGSSDMAIVGGVQVMLTPAAYISFGMAGMLSGDGKCKTFDKRANGYVRGEGVGAIFLKPLAMAEADGNHIYALIKATAENHGGRVTTLTAPNSSAQAELLIEAYEKAQIDPGTVGYIECHGTGTSLGDPIEIQALKKSFAELYKRHGRKPAAEPHCGLSSVKTNIGHLETAAGIAGILKALLAIKHRQIPANIHFEEVNPYIDLANSPFYIVGQTTAWKPARDADGNSLPLRAGVSSFGFGGANAHIVLEEYVPVADTTHGAADDPQLIVLSAKNEERLKAYARSMLEYVDRHSPDLTRLAHTLQVGRDEMPERMAFVACRAEDVTRKLHAFLRDDKAAEGIYHDNVKRRKEPGPAGEEPGAAAIAALMEQRVLSPLAALWVSGAVIDWRPLYASGAPRRLSLPTYPFSRERYWVSGERPSGALSVEGLHPLIQRNVSTLTQQKFASRFTGDEFYLADHVVETRKILPGVAYMEMARVAGTLAGEEPVRFIRNLVWLQPIAVEPGGKEVELSLSPARGQVDFAVRTGEGKHAVTHCTGRVAYSGSTAGPDVLDIDAIKRRCSEQVLTGTEVYDYFSASGLQLGGSFRIVQNITGNGAESLAVLKLPQHLTHDAGRYWLHPALMDGSMHSAIGLMKQSGMALPLSLPFSVGEVQIIHSLENLCYGYATWASDEPRNERSLMKVNFQLLDQDGRVLVRMKDFISKPLRQRTDGAAPRDASAGSGRAAPGGAERASGLKTLAPVWNVAPPAPPDTVHASTSSRVLLLADDRAAHWLRSGFPAMECCEWAPGADDIEAKLGGREFDQLLWIAPDVIPDGAPGVSERSLVEQQETGVIAVFRIIKALLALDHGDKDLHWTLVTRRTQRVDARDCVAPAHAGISGLVGSLAKEYPRWKLRVLDVDSLASVTAQACLSLPWNARGDGLALRRGEWFSQALAWVEPTTSSGTRYRQDGVYVVIGGAGGLGEVWSRFMIEHQHARVVWIGRRPCSAAIQQKIDALSGLGVAPLYVQADATDEQALRAALAAIQVVHPVIHGVVHSALVLKDQRLTHMDESGLRASLSAKVDISVNMDRVFGALDLDFMLFFSSLISFVKTPGQSNYAAGCTFKDGFAHSLEGRHYPVKIMNWGFWGSVGVVADASHTKAMEQMGIGSIEADEGMQALRALVDSPLGQVALVKTLHARAVEAFDLAESLTVAPGTAKVLPLVGQMPAHQLPAAQARALERELPSAELESLVAQLLAASLRSLGLLADGAAALADLRLDPPPARYYERWLGSSIRYLEQRQDAAVRPLDELWSEWEAQKPRWHAANPNQGAQIALLETCLRALPEIVSGRRRATDVIFPQSSMNLVEGIYRDNAVADHFNDVLSKTLENCVEQWRRANPAADIKILEIGAGTGGTTALLLPLLQRLSGSVSEYCYTDLSKAFLMYANERFRPLFPALTTALFDVTKVLSEQSMPLGRYDVVIATNVLHATPNIRETLRNAKAALKSGGVLLLNEISGWNLFSHLTFGLLEGWWLHEDTALRIAGSPGLAPAAWAEILSAEGFDSIVFPAEAVHRLGQQIIAASSDGLVRQKPAREARPPGAVGAPGAERAQAAQAVKEAQAAPAARSSGPLRDSNVKRVLKEKLAEALKMAPANIRDDDAFADYGVDSIIGVNLVRTINEALRIDLETTSLFEYSTVNLLSEHICTTRHGVAAPAAEDVASRAFVDGDAATPAFVDVDAEPRASADDTPVQRFATGNAAARRASSDDRADSIAIIGMSGRFAGSETLDEFWANLRDGVDLVKGVTRWDAAECLIAEADGRRYCSSGSFIESIELFDPAFFRITPLEALYMDPQQRLFLEESWKALEDAGYAGAGIDSKQCGVYVGCGSSHYDDLFVEEPPAQAFWGNAESVIPARIAYYLNLHGPAIAVNTACSSSLVTIHLACQSLWAGETEMALAGGVFLQATPNFHQVSNGAGMLSPDGKCYSFDARANGFVPGEGVGVVVLKRLEEAVRDGDHIHGVIAGSGINQDGRSNGLIAPSARAQEKLQRDVYESFGIDPRSIQMVEAHGTGTLLGDSIEVEAITRSFREYTAATQFCALGSVKSNLGHAATAAGIAGVLKILLALKHRQLPPSLNFLDGNPGIDFDGSPFYVNTELKEWAAGEGKRRAAISSFGFSGTNAHLVIEEAPAVEPRRDGAPGYMVALSAATLEQLRQQVRALLAFSKHSPAVSLNDLAYSLLIGRRHFSHRFCCVVGSLDELRRSLETWADGGTGSRTYTSEGTIKVVRDHASLQRFGNHCIAGCRNAAGPAEYLDDLATVADLYVQGLVLDFPALFPADSRRIPLPTYAFARERYWVAGSGYRSRGAQRSATPALHPLLHVNTSTLSHQSYSSVFTGGEPFLVAHPVPTGSSANKELPRMAYLEMARAAVRRCAPQWPGTAVLELHRTVWASPLLVGRESVRVTIALVGREDGQVDFEIFSGDAESEIIHCQGRAGIGGGGLGTALDLAGIRQRLHAGIDVGDLYDELSAAGRHYEPGQRVVTSLDAGDDEWLVQLRLPEGSNEEPAANVADHVLHPGILDGALLVCIHQLPEVADAGPGLDLDLLRVLSSCSRHMVAWIRRGHGAGLDIDLADAEGRVIAQLQGLASRRTQVEPVPEETDPTGAEDRIDDLLDEQSIPWGTGRPSREQLLERVVWRDTADTAHYEKMTF